MTLIELLIKRKEANKHPVAISLVELKSNGYTLEKLREMYSNGEIEFYKGLNDLYFYINEKDLLKATAEKQNPTGN